MAGFTYWTISADRKMKGSVSVDYFRNKMMQKKIEGVGTARDGSFVELYFSDGSSVIFTLNADFGPEVQISSPTR